MSYHKYLLTCLVMMLPMAPGIALAQNAPSTNAPNTFALSGVLKVPLPLSFVGPFAAVGKGLAQSGISVRFQTFDQFFANGNGGVTPGATNNVNAIAMGFDVDLGKSFGLTGAKIHYTETLFTLKDGAGLAHPYAAEVGSYGAASFVQKRVPATYLSVLTYEQSLLDGRLDFQVGRQNPTISFDQPNSDNLLTNQNPITQYTADEPSPPFSQWGGYAQYKFTPIIQLRAGAFEDHFSQTSTTNGYNWSTRGATGAILLAQIGTDENFSDAVYPETYNLTVFRNTSKYTDPDNSKLHEPGAEGIIFKGLQTIWRSDGGASISMPAHHMTVFTTTSWTPNAYQPYSAYSEVGANYYGLFPNRPLDRIGMKVTWINVSSNELAFEEASRIALGGPHKQTSSNEFRFEISTLFHLPKGVLLEPAIMYLVNPDTHFAPHTAAIPKNGYLVGAGVLIPIGSILGISRQAPP